MDPKLKIGPFPASFFFIFVFSILLIVQLNFADDWVRTADLWCGKRPLYQLRHNHFPWIQSQLEELFFTCCHNGTVFIVNRHQYKVNGIHVWGAGLEPSTHHHSTRVHMRKPQQGPQNTSFGNTQAKSSYRKSFLYFRCVKSEV